MVSAPMHTQGYRPLPAMPRVEGAYLVVPSHTPLPDVCVKCGVTHAPLARREQAFTYTPMWTIALLLVSWVIGLIVMKMLQRDGRLSVPLCPACDARWRGANLVKNLAAVGVVLLVVLPPILLVAAEARSMILPTIIATFSLGVIGLAALQFLFVRPRTLWAQKITHHDMTMGGAHPNALAAIARLAHPHAR
jgi:hypothetical protein